jgi:hypothetical protein
LEFLRVVPLAANPSGILAPRKTARRYIRARGVPSARSAGRRASTCRRTGAGIGRREWDGDPKGKALPLLTGLCKTCKERRHSELCLARVTVSTAVDIQLRQIDAKPKRQPQNAKTARRTSGRPASRRLVFGNRPLAPGSGIIEPAHLLALWGFSAAGAECVSALSAKVAPNT